MISLIDRGYMRLLRPLTIERKTKMTQEIITQNDDCEWDELNPGLNDGRLTTDAVDSNRVVVCRRH